MKSKCEFEFQTQKPSQKMHELNEAFVEWSLLSTFHCYPKIFQYKSKPMKFLWSTIFILFSAATSYLVITSFSDFLEYRVVSTIRIIEERPTLFPVVTICDNNPFTSLFAQNLIDSIVNETNLTSFKSVIDYTKMFVLSSNFTEIDRKKLGNTLNNSTIHSCRFSGRACDFTNDFTSYYDFNYGNCVQFNAKSRVNKLKKIYLEGLFYGLSLQIGPLVNENRKYATATSKGLKVFVHNQSYPPTSSEGISIKTGEEANVAVKKSFFHNTPSPYSQCIDLKFFRSFLYDFMTKNLSMVYKQKLCLYLYGQLSITNKCKCYNTRNPMIIQSPPCLSKTQLECVNQDESSIDEEKLNAAKSECPLECDSVSYDLYTSSLEYPSRETYESFGMSNVNFTMFRENYLALNVYFLSTQYTDIDETPKTSVLELIANVGGVIGIFLGFSIFSLIEIVELFFQMVFVLFFTKKTNPI